MTSDHDQRLQKVERQLAQVKWLNRCLVVCVVLALTVWGLTRTFGPETARAKPGVNEIRANAFVLEDENGKTRATLDAYNKDAPGLRFFDENGNVRFAVVANNDAPFLSFHENGNIRLMVGKITDAWRLSMPDENAKELASLMVGKNGPALTLSGNNGKSNTTLCVNQNSPILVMFGENGNQRVGLAVEKSGPALHLSDENAKPRVRLAVDENGTMLRLRDTNGKARAVLTVLKDTPFLALYDEKGKATWNTP